MVRVVDYAMAKTQTIPMNALGGLNLHAGDTLHVLAVMDSGFLVSIEQQDGPKPGGSAEEWLKSARGSVKLDAGESADDIRMSYYREKHGLDS